MIELRPEEAENLLRLARAGKAILRKNDNDGEKDDHLLALLSGHPDVQNIQKQREKENMKELMQKYPHMFSKEVLAA